MTTLLETLMPAYAPVTPLRAGPISLLFSNGDLRQLRVGGVEVVQRIYVAVRDQDWDTAPVTLRDLVINDHGDRFRITFTAIHRLREIGFTWQGAVVGDADGTIKFTMDGRADTTFRRNRIGFCVLHPASAAGARATLTHTDGSRSASTFPTLISPHQPFKDLAAIIHEFTPGQEVEVSFEGDIFESEDQRNWTDASYKTYSTPLAIPYPVTIEAGTTVRQAVGVRLLGAGTRSDGANSDNALTVTVQTGAAGKLPALGLGIASDGQPLTADEVARLAALKLGHLRVDLDLGNPAFAATLARATEEAKALDLPLEVALFVGKDVAGEVAALQRAVADSGPLVARWLLFARHANVTPASLAEAARPVLHMLAPAAPVGGGTNLYFVHINREHPPVQALDFVVYSINPQVHAFDLVSLVENMTAQPSSVESARAISGDLPIVISPITLRARFNADAVGPEAATPLGELPYAVDVRQPTGFAAAWTLGSLAALATAGVASLTYYETVGWRGVMERAAGSPVPAKFPSTPGMLFPLYHLFATLAPYAEGDLLPTVVSDPQQIAALTVAQDGQHCTIVGNLRDTAQRVAIHGLQGRVALQTLNDPAGDIEFEPEAGPLWVELAPYALVSLQQKRT